MAIKQAGEDQINKRKLEAAVDLDEQLSRHIILGLATDIMCIRHCWISASYSSFV